MLDSWIVKTGPPVYRRELLLPLLLVTTLSACGEDRPREPVGPDPKLRFNSISAGQDHTCALDTRGYAFCWGRNDSGQLGAGATTDRLQPTLVSDELRFESIGTGFAHTCGLTVQDEVLCWGGNQTGQLGDGTTAGRGIPEPVPGGRRFVGLAVGSYHVCAVTTSDEIYCWGAAGLDMDAGALGGSATETCTGYYGASTWPCSTTPVRAPGNPGFESLSAGVFYGCGLTRTEEAYCWGWNFYSQLGNDSIAHTSEPVPVTVDGAATFQAIDAGGGHACAIRGGAGYCWSEAPLFGLLGNGARTGSSTPVPVTGGISFRSLRPSRGNTSVLRATVPPSVGE